MARAILQVPVVNGVPQLPPMSSDDGYCLHELVGGKVRDGSGYSVVGHVPPDATRVLMLIDTSDATLATMVKSGTYPYFASVTGKPVGWPAPTATLAQALTACRVNSTEYQRAERQALAMPAAAEVPAGTGEVGGHKA